MKLSKIFSAVAIMLTLFVGISIAQTQWANTQVTLRSETVGRGGNFYLNTHSIGQDICIIFVLDSTSYNVVGQPDFTGTRITIPASSGNGDVYVGRFAAASNAAWYASMTFTYHHGACAYSENQAAPVPDGLKLTGYKTVANLDYHNGFTVDAPVELKYQGQESSKTNEGVNYTSQTWTAELPNGDLYYVGAATYPFTVDAAGMATTFANDFSKGVKGEVKSTRNVTVSGLPALAAVVEATIDGKMLRFGVLVVVRGNKVYAFIFGTDVNAPGTNMDDVATFFKSAALN
jgi:hypothetical protein